MVTDPMASRCLPTRPRIGRSLQCGHHVVNRVDVI